MCGDLVVNCGLGGWGVRNREALLGAPRRGGGLEVCLEERKKRRSDLEMEVGVKGN